LQLKLLVNIFQAKGGKWLQRSSKVALLEKELANSKEAIKSLTKQLESMNHKYLQDPFMEESLCDASDDAIGSYSALAT